MRKLVEIESTEHEKEFRGSPPRIVIEKKYAFRGRVYKIYYQCRGKNDSTVWHDSDAWLAVLSKEKGWTFLDGFKSVQGIVGKKPNIYGARSDERSVYAHAERFFDAMKLRIRYYDLIIGGSCNKGDLKELVTTKWERCYDNGEPYAYYENRIYHHGTEFYKAVHQKVSGGAKPDGDLERWNGHEWIPLMEMWPSKKDAFFSSVEKKILDVYSIE